jgi:hypothetical protein
VAVGRAEDSAAVARRQPRPFIRLDCTGSARPSAAESWSPDSTGRVWTFVIAPSAIPVTAGSAASEWNSRPDAATVLRQAGVASVVPLDERRLVVTLPWTADSVPAFFAHPALSLTTDSLPDLSPFVLRRPASGDLRDAIEGDADVLRSGDPSLVQYARTRDAFVVHALPWDRTYLLIIPKGREGFRTLIEGDTTAFRAALARDAVPAEARAAEPPYWWDQLRYCPPADVFPRPQPAGQGGGRAVVAAEDTVARALASRFVGLSSDPAAFRIVAPEPLMGRLLRGGSAEAFVVSVPRTPTLPCLEVALWPPGATVIPLVDTRMTAIARKGVPPLTVDYDGTLRRAERR